MTDTNPNKTKPVYKIKPSTAKPAAPPPGQERRADQREDQREDRRQDRRENQREDQREAQRTDRREDRRTTPYDNRDQDPNHPANITPARDPNAPATATLPPEAYMTEQEKAAMAGGVPSSKVPYPTGDPAPIRETTTRSQGIKGAIGDQDTPVDSTKKRTP